MTIAMSPEITRPPRVAKVYPEVEPVTLDDFDIDDVREYLRLHDGGAPRSRDDFHVPREDMNRIATLLLCGQRTHAIAEIHQLVGEYLGRTI